MNGELKNLKRKQAAEGLILGISGIILFLDFGAIDAEIFGVTAPPIIQQISSYVTLSPLVIDIVSTIILITILLMFRTQRELGRFE